MLFGAERRRRVSAANQATKQSLHIAHNHVAVAGINLNLGRFLAALAYPLRRLKSPKLDGRLSSPATGLQHSAQHLPVRWQTVG
jgi:hypothetical protein